MERQSLIPQGHVIPIPENRRNSTDVFCTIFGAIYALTFFILACIFFRSEAINKAYFNFAQTSVQHSDHYGFRTAFWATALSSLGLGLIWLSLVHCFPRTAPHMAHIGAIIALIVLGILTLVVQSNYYGNHNGWKIAVAVVAFVLALIIFCMFWFYSAELRLQGIFLDYSRRFLYECSGTFGYIVLFFVLVAAFIALIVFQHLAFTSRGNKDANYWDFTNPGVLGVFNILEFIWGFQFLRDAFNFCVAGRATDWYWNNQQARWYTPLQRLLTRHWGSVVGGSFLNAFFEVPTLIVEFLTCHSTTCCAKAGNFCENRCPWGYFFNIIRTDSYSYINLAGVPFCNAGRECFDICFNAQQFVGGYNPLKHYHFVASTLLVTIGYILGHLYANKRVYYFDWWHNVIIILTAYIVICWFVKIDADSAEGISTSFFAEHRLANDYERMIQAQQPYRDEIRDRARRDVRTKDGNC